MYKIIAAAVAIVLASVSAMPMAIAQDQKILSITATLSPDKSNQFLAVKTFRLFTNDQVICPGVTLFTMDKACTYTLEKGELRPNSVTAKAFVFDGSLKASGQTSKFFDMRADLSKSSESSASGHLIQNLTGTINFGNQGPSYDIGAATFDATNNTLHMASGIGLP